MSINNKIKNKMPAGSENPFRVPQDYFDTLRDRVMDQIRKEQPIIERPGPRKISLRPFIALAASISGLALIVYVVLQLVIGSQLEYSETYDLTLLEKAGIALDESAIAETYINSKADSYTDWEKEAMTFLASNEVDLLHLLVSN